MASQLQKDYVWNTASGMMIAASTAIMLLVVTRAAGTTAAGIFFLATSVGQWFQALGMYEVRPYQATDVQKHFTFGTYHAVRIVTTALMVVGIVMFPLISGRAGIELAAFISVAALRVLDAFEDVFISEFQRVGRLDIGGRISFVRVFTTTALFCAAIIVTGDLLVSSLFTLAVSFVLMAILIVSAARSRFDLAPSFTWKPMRRLLRTCFPLAAASFLALYLSMAPRFAVESYMDDDHIAYFGILFMPAFAINLLSGLIFRPLLTRMAVEWVSQKIPEFTRLIFQGLLASFGAFLLTFVAAYLIGVPLLNFLYGVDIAPFRVEMLVLVAGGAFNATSIILYYALTTMRYQNAVFVGYGVAAVLVLGLAPFLVARMGIMGASIAYLAAMATLTFAFALAAIYFLRTLSVKGIS